MTWTDEQSAAIESRGHTLLVSAAAGSGKTAVLVERLLRRVTDEGCDINSFLIITYTKAAASELRAKIIDALNKKSAQSPNNRHLSRQLTLVHLANISTVHAYCTALLREHGHLIGLRTDFKIMDEGEADILRGGILDDIIEERFAEGESGFLALADALCGERSDRALCETILELHEKARSHPYPEKWLKSAAADYDLSGITDVAETKWGAVICDNAQKTVSDAYFAAQDALRRADCNAELDNAYRPALESDLFQLEGLIAALKKGWDAAVSVFETVSFERLGSTRKVEDKELIELVKTIRDGYKGNILKLKERDFSARSDALLKELADAAPIVEKLCGIAAELDNRFAAEKRSRALMDYSDLEHFAIQLLVEDYDEENDAVTPTALAKTLANDFTEILLDEFQDSNCVQDILFRALSRSEKNIVMVGDVKQSIYRFRLADPTIFMKKYKSFKHFEDAVGDEPRCVTLSKNFRSRAEVLDASNSLFSRIMTEQLGEIDYTPREYLRLGLNTADIPNQNNKTELVLVDLKEPDGDSDETPPEKLDAEARFIADKIRSIVASGYLITDKESGAARAVGYSDIVILLRSAVAKSGAYEAALAERGMPCSSEKAEGLLDTVEVRVIAALLSVTDNPLQDIPLISVLKSPLFGFTADDLCYIRRAGDRELYYAAERLAREEKTHTAEKCRAFLELLNELRDLAAGTPVDRLLWLIYNRTNALGLFGAMENGGRRQANLISLYRRAESFESDGYRGLYGFNAYLARLYAQGADLPADASGAGGLDAVTIMTIHKSKGLEFPIVFLAGCNRNFNLDDTKRHTLFHPKLGIGMKMRNFERMTERTTAARSAIAQTLARESKSEEMRILYVAMTRARDKLYIISTIKNAEKRLYGMSAQSPGAGAAAPSVLAQTNGLNPWLVLPALKSAEGKKLREYAGIPEWEYKGAGSLNGFDVSIVEYSGGGNAEPRGTAPDEHTVKQADAELVSELTRRFTFRYPHTAAEDAPSKLTATGLYGYFDEGVERVRRRRNFTRPGFILEKSLTPAERGTALHMAMQFIDFNKCGSVEEIRGEIKRLAEREFLSHEQAAAVDPTLIKGFFDSDIGREVLGAKSLKREFKFSILVPADSILKDAELGGEKILLQGVIDLYFETDGGITILDFKTDRISGEPEPEQLVRYKTQLDAYSLALGEVTGGKVTRRILYFITANRAVRL